jgi:transcriptional regulator with XRE-family HTH domain
MSDRFDGARLRARRKRQRLTVEDVARLASLRYAFVVTLERNEARPSISALERLCAALDCDPRALFTAGPDDDERPTELGRAADEWIAQTLAAAPPLTGRQARNISAILFGRGGS